MPGPKFTAEQIQEASKRRYQEWLARHKTAAIEKQAQRISQLEKIPDVDLAYAAGIIDGEGAVCISRRKNRCTLRATIAVAMCEPEAVGFLYDIFGGSHQIRIIGHKNRPEHRAQDLWGVAAKQAAAVCRVIVPFLKVKKQQAKNIIELQEIHEQITDFLNIQRQLRHKKSFSAAEKGPFPRQPELDARSEELWLSQRALNMRGHKVHKVTAQMPRAASAAMPSSAGVLNPNAEAA